MKLDRGLNRSLVGLDGLFLLAIMVLVLYAKASGLSEKELFLPPDSYPHFTVGSLTRLFQILCVSRRPTQFW